MKYRLNKIEFGLFFRYPQDHLRYYVVPNLMKTKPPKEIRERRDQARKAAKAQELLSTIIGMHPRAFWLTVFGLTIGAASLVFTILQFQARPTALLGDPFDPKNVLTTPIIISNDGMSDLEDVRFYTYVTKLDYKNSNTHIEIADNGTADRIFDDVVSLTPGDKQEVTPTQGP